MPREARIVSSTNIYHIMLRGINGQRIFEETEDYRRFLGILAKVKVLSGFELFAYCLMGNHVHLLLRVTNEPLELIFKRIGTRYAFWFNWKYERTGHLFQDRFRSEPIESECSFLAVARYIYQNPVKAGLCLRAADYEWSSRRLLGCGDGIIDESAMSMIVSFGDISAIADGMCDMESINNLRNRRDRLSDEKVAVLINNICGVKSTSSFQELPKTEQRMVIQALRKARIPIRQVARITGINRGLVDRWGKLESITTNGCDK